MLTDLLKKSLLAGLGAAIVTRETAEKALSDLVEKGRISSEEAQEAADRLVEEGRNEFDRRRTEINEAIAELLSKANFATQPELKELKLQIAALEARLAVLEKPELGDGSVPEA